MEDVGELLCGGSMRMPTASIASLRLDVDAWRDVRAGGATLQWLVKPKILR
jgi:phosphohistidine phosphatase SixA